jgi:hypothetical protein
MKHLKLFEQHTEYDIYKICRDMRLSLRNWSISSDGLVDVDGNVDLSYKNLTKLPFNFGYVLGYFHCYGNELTSLEGAPRSVGRGFNCSHNKLTSLRFAPEEIGGSIIILPNPISDIRIPQEFINNFLGQEFLRFIVKEQPEWRLYRKDGTIHPERLEQMIEWGIETNKIKPI